MTETIYYKRYSITNRVQKVRAIEFAPSAQEACEQAGWLIGDCYIKERGCWNCNNNLWWKRPNGTEYICNRCHPNPTKKGGVNVKGQ